MIESPTRFMYSLAKAIAAAATLAMPPTVTAAAKADLWVGQADERFAGDPWTVLIDYAGPAQAMTEAQRINVQVKTVGLNRDSVRDRAWSVYKALLASDDRPLRMTQISGYTAAQASDGHWMIVGCDALQRPGSLGRDEKGRWSFVFNVEVAFYRID